MARAVWRNAAAAALLVLAARLCAAQLLSVNELPVPSQSSQRLLACITAVAPTKLPMIEKQLHNYVEACEMGWEVHVVFVTLRLPNASKPEEDLFRPPSLFHCKRLEQALPVAAWVYSGGDHKLAAQHRKVMMERVEHYDYFLSQEEDMDVRPSHLRYYQHWEPLFAGQAVVPVLPGFTPYEVVMGTHPAPNAGGGGPSAVQPPPPPARSRYHHPIAFLHHHQPQMLTYINGTLCLVPRAPYSMFWLAPQSVIKAAVSKDFWLGDIDQPWYEYNIHFQGSWLPHHVRIAIPLAALRHSLVHHGSDKYIPNDLPNTYNTTSNIHRNHMGSVSLHQFETLFSLCLGQEVYQPPRHTNKMAAAWWDSWQATYKNITYASRDGSVARSATPCQECLKRGLTAYVGVNLKGLHPTIVHGASTEITVNVDCVQGIPPQDKMGCRNYAKCGPGDVDWW